MGFWDWLFGSSETLDRIEDRVTHIQQQIQLLEERQMLEFEALKAAVAEQTTVINSAIVLLNELEDRLEAMKDAPTPQDVQNLLDTVIADKEALAAAVAENTPGA